MKINCKFTSGIPTELIEMTVKEVSKGRSNWPDREDGYKLNEVKVRRV